MSGKSKSGKSGKSKSKKQQKQQSEDIDQEMEEEQQEQIERQENKNKSKSKNKNKNKNKPKSKSKSKSKNNNGDIFKQKTKSSLAGLTFPVGRVRRYMKEGGYSQRISMTAAVALAGILEYLTVEIIELSGEAAKDNKTMRIKPRWIQLAIKGDDELNVLLQNVTIRDGGVKPHIHANLLGGRKNGKGKGKSKSKGTGSQSQYSESQQF